MSEMAKYPDAIYLACDAFGGDRDVDVRNSTIKIVTVRKPFHCFLCRKDKPAGTRAYYEHAVVDGEWQSNRVCLPCLDFEVVDDMYESGCFSAKEEKLIKAHMRKRAESCGCCNEDCDRCYPPSASA